MSRYYLNLFIGILLISLGCGCGNSGGKGSSSVKIDTMHKPDDKNFDSTILIIDRTVVDLTVPDDLFTIDRFISLYKHPAFYLDSVVNFLNNPNNSQQQKLICIFAMQRLELSEYLLLSDKAIDLFNNGKIDESVFKKVFDPRFSNKPPVLIKNYDDPKVAQILIKAMNTNCSPEVKKRINSIATGEYWRSIRNN